MNKLTKTLATLGLVGTLAGCASNQTKPVAQAQQLAYSMPVGAQATAAPSAFDGWTIPLLIGGAGLAALFIFKK